MFMKKFYLCRRRLDRPPPFPASPAWTSSAVHDAPARERQEEEEGSRWHRQEKVPGGRPSDHGRASSGVGGGSSLENLIDSGNEHLAMDRVEEGLNDLRKACALVPDSADAWDAYGMALAEFGAPDDAIKVLKRAAQLSPNIGYEKVSFFFYYFRPYGQ